MVIGAEIERGKDVKDYQTFSLIDFSCYLTEKNNHAVETNTAQSLKDL